MILEKNPTPKILRVRVHAHFVHASVCHKMRVCTHIEKALRPVRWLFLTDLVNEPV